VYCPESDPFGTVIVTVPLNLLDQTYRLVGSLHLQPTSTLAIAIEILASSIAGPTICSYEYDTSTVHTGGNLF